MLSLGYGADDCGDDIARGPLTGCDVLFYLISTQFLFSKISLQVSLNKAQNKYYIHPLTRSLIISHRLSINDIRKVTIFLK